MTRICFCPAFVLAAALLAPNNASARTLDEAMKGLAGSVQSYLAAKRETGVVIGRFDASEGITSARMLRERLADALQRENVESREKGLTLRGALSNASASGRAKIAIRLTMVDAKGAPVRPFDALEVAETVDLAEDVARIAGATFARPESEAPQAALSAALSAPEFELPIPGGGVVKPQGKSPYRIELLVRPAGVNGWFPCPVESWKGRPFARVAPADEIAVRLYNDSDADCAVRLSIDGLNCFEFSEDSAVRSHGLWLVRKGSRLLLRGWHRSETFTESFRPSGVPASAAGRVAANEGTVGSVNALFYAVWAKDAPQPPIEPVGTRCAGRLLRIPVGKRIPAAAVVVPGKPGLSAPAPPAFEYLDGYAGRTLQASISIFYGKPAERGVTKVVRPRFSTQARPGSPALAMPPGC